MTNLKKDTEPGIFLRFHVSENKVESFLNAFSRIIQLDPLASMKGLSYDVSNMIIVFEYPIDEKNSLHDIVKTIHNIFLRLYDFYPAISEKPSEHHEQLALNYVRDTNFTANNAHNGNSFNRASAKILTNH